MLSPETKKQKTSHLSSNRPNVSRPNVNTTKSQEERTDSKLKSFLEWCTKANFTINNKVTVSKQGSCAQYGLIAVGDIQKGETLFHVPRSALLHPESSSIKDIFAKNTLQSTSGWVPLLLCLMYEYTNPSSFWRPYLDAFPTFEELELPMFWDSEEVVDELKGTGIPEAVARDVKNIHEEYKNIVLPFMKKETKLFDLDVHTLELYKKMVAFVMSYSFTEPRKISETEDDDDEDEDDNDDEDSNSYHPPPIMVPLADALNHVAKNNAHLRFCKESLKMVATKSIKKGQEIFNTFGELGNEQLLHMYGFSEAYPHNIHETVDVPMKYILEQAKLKSSNAKMLDERWQYLQRLDIVAEEGNFVIGQEGILTLDELYTTLKVLTMDSESFKEFKSNDGWESDDDEDEACEALMNGNLHKLPSNWKDLLQNVFKFCLKQYKNTFDEDKDLLKDEAFNKLTKRQQYALHVRIGQKQLLTKSLNLLHKPEELATQPVPGQGDHCVLS